MCVKLLRWFVVYTQTIRVVPRFQTFRPYGWKVFFIRDVSLLSSQSVRNNNPPAMRVRDRCYTKKSPFRSIIELFKLNNTNRKVILWLIKRTAYLTQNGCANII